VIKYEEALDAILNNTKELSTEKVLIENSVNMTLAEDVYSPIEMPPFNKSAMDGYAVRAIDVKKTPVRLECIGFIEAGQSFKKKVGQGQCVKIMTGASLPEDSDSVVRVEDCRQFQDYVEITKSVRKWQNVCIQGEDIKKKEKVLAGGKVIYTSDIALLATVGRRQVRVTRKPKVVILNTGGEIIPAGRGLSGKKIYNSNGPQLLALLKSDGVNPCFSGIAKDDFGELKEAVKKGLRGDVLLISGGVSMGDYDLVPGVLESLGVRKIFHNIKVKPGKPLLFGRHKSTIVFGIPGNPVSNFLAYHTLIRPALWKMMGKVSSKPLFEEGILEEAFYHKRGRKHFVPVKISKRGYRSYVVPVESHGSADTLGLSKADGFMAVDANTSVVKAKSKIKFILWKNEKSII